MKAPACLLLPARAVPLGALAAAAPPAAPADAEPWEAALHGLEACVAPAAARGKLTVWLSHHFCGLHWLPAPAVRLPPAEMQGWLLESLIEAYGEEAAHWRLVWQDVPPGRPVPVASLDMARYDSLHSRLLSLQCANAAIRPWWDAAWPLLSAAAPRGTRWLAAVEPGRALIARVEGRRVLALESARLEATEPLPAQLAAEIARIALRRGEAAEGVARVLAPEQSPDWTAAGQGGATGLRLEPVRATRWAGLFSGGRHAL